MKQFATIFFLFVTISLSAQETQISVLANSGLGYRLNEKNIYEPGFSGAGIKLNQIRQIKTSPFSVIWGMELSYSGWGTQTLVQTGFKLKLPEFWKFQFALEASSYYGISLLKSNPQYVNALEILPVIRYELNDRLGIQLASGIRYTASSGYRKYGPIWAYLDLPIRIDLIIK